MSEQNGKFEAWALLELMGHQKIVGLVSEVSIAGKGMLRVDVPDKDGVTTAYTRFYSTDAVYAINPVDKQIALGLAANIDAKPVHAYDLRRLIADKKVGDMDYVEEAE